GSRAFEIDQPQVLDFKERAVSGVEPSCAHHALRTDLRVDWPAVLPGAGFDPGVSTAWVAEVLLSYLPSEDESGVWCRTGTVPSSARSTTGELPGWVRSS